MKQEDTFFQNYRKMRKICPKLKLTPRFSYGNLTSLVIQNANSDIDLSFLYSFNWLSHLSIYNLETARLDLEPLQEIRNLSYLQIEENAHLRTLDLKPIANLKQLTNLILRKNGLKHLDLSSFKKNSSLKTLNIEQAGGYNLNDRVHLIQREKYEWWTSSQRYYKDCEEEGYKRHHIKLNYYPTNLKTIDLSFLSSHPTLTNLFASYNANAKITFPKASLTSLEVVDLAVNNIINLNLKNLVSPKTTSINLQRANIETINLNGLRKCKKLKFLNLRENKLTEIDLSPLSDLYNLQVLNFSRNRLKNIELSSLSNQKSLRILDLQSNDITKLDTNLLSKCSKLELLNFGDNLITQLDLEFVKNLPLLKILRLTRNSLKQLDLSPLANCQFIEKVQLARNNLDFLSLKPLKNKRYLNEINLDRNPFLNLDLSALEDIKNIHFLDITDSSNISKLDITPILSGQSNPWVNIGDTENVKLDVGRIKSLDLNKSFLATHKSVLDAINFRKHSKKLLNSKTDIFAVKAVEEHENINDLLLQRLLEERTKVSAKIRERVKSLAKLKKEEKGDK